MVSFELIRGRGDEPSNLFRVLRFCMPAPNDHLACLARLAQVTLALTVQFALSAAVMAGTVNVVFVQPEHFTDIGKWPRDRSAAENESEISRHLEQLAARTLPAAQSLSVEVLDVDLAGRLEPQRRSGDQIRVMRGVTWPSIRLRYTLQQGGQVIAQGEETVADMNYLDPTNSYPEGDALRYEKRMLDRWFHERLVALQPAPK